MLNDGWRPASHLLGELIYICLPPAAHATSKSFSRPLLLIIGYKGCLAPYAAHNLGGSVGGDIYKQSINFNPHPLWVADAIIGAANEAFDKQ